MNQSGQAISRWWPVTGLGSRPRATAVALRRREVWVGTGGDGFEERGVGVGGERWEVGVARWMRSP
jgi:hypothetical protein